MSANRFNQHPVVVSLAPYGQRAATLLRRVPARRWRLLYLGLIALWIVHSLATGFWVVVPEPDLPQPALVPPPKTGSVANESSDVDLAALQQYSLFGEATAAAEEIVEPEPSALPGIEQNAVDTSLSLRLQGVMASSNADNAWAIIADGNEQALYTVGDRLPQGSNVKLVKVLDQRVILDNNGRYESLWLYSKEDARQRAYSDDTAYVEDVVEEEQYEDPAAESDYSTVTPAEDEGQDGSDPEVHTLPADAEGVTSISEVVRFTAARGEDGMMGYRLQPGRNRDLFDQAGLQPGDVVTAVNGINLDDPRQIRAVYQVLQQASQAELSIVRDGEPVEVYITLDSAR